MRVSFAGQIRRADPRGRGAFPFAFRQWSGALRAVESSQLAIGREHEVLTRRTMVPASGSEVKPISSLSACIKAAPLPPSDDTSGTCPKSAPVELMTGIDDTDDAAFTVHFTPCPATRIW